MNTASLIRLVTLAAIWGAAYLFMRIGAPILGPWLLVTLRVGLAALFLLAVGAVLKKRLRLRTHWRHYLLIGLFNSALPFLLIAFAAQTLSASLLSILNATSPIWGAAVGAAWTRTPLAARQLIGMLLGVAGVALLAGVEASALPAGAALATLAALGAALSYGVASTYAKSAPAVEPYANAHGSMWAATLLIAPALLFHAAPAVVPDARLIGVVLALGVVCSGVAFLLYFRLIADLGAVSALTVTFLIPVFGVLWGHLFLGEAIGWHTLIGAAVVMLGTALSNGFSPRVLWPGLRGRGAQSQGR